MVNCSRAASTTARSMRTGSSRNRTDGIADAADQPAIEIVEAADVVDDRERADVVEERVDGEVAAERVFFRRAVGVVAMNEARSLGVLRRAVAVGRSDSAATLPGRRPRRGGTAAASISGVSSFGSTCRRNVATSMVLVPNLTCARRNRRPMIQQLRKSFLT